MARIRVKRGRASVVIGDRLERQIRSLLTISGVSIVDELEDVGTDAVAHARMLWPIQSGKSSEGLHSFVAIAGKDKLKLVVTNRVKYAFMAKWVSITAWTLWHDDSKAGRRFRYQRGADRKPVAPPHQWYGKRPWQKLVTRRKKELTKEIVARVGEAWDLARRQAKGRV